MLGFWPLGQFALGQPGPISSYVVPLTLNAYGCMCVSAAVWIGPPIGPTSNVTRTGPGPRDNIVV